MDETALRARGEVLLRTIFFIVLFFLIVGPLVIFLGHIGVIPDLICTKNQYTGQKDCTPHNPILVLLWEIGEGLNYFGPAVSGLAALLVAAFTWMLWWSTNKLWEANEWAIEISRQAFIADQRPWIAVDFSLGSGLTWAQNGEPRVTINFALRNTGRTPALNVETWCEMFPMVGEQDPRARQRKFAAGHRTKKHAGGFGITLFPGSQFTMGHNIGASPDEMQATKDWFKRSFGKEYYGFPFTIVGCITYYLVFDDEPRQTGFVLDLSRFDPAHPHMSFVIDQTQGNLPIDRLQLRHSFIGSGITD